MARLILDSDRIHPGIRERLAKRHKGIIDEVEAAIQSNDIVVVGMGWNPHPRRACKALEAKGLAYKYLRYGNYLGPWRRRNALKIWSGWPTFPMCFVRGTLVGGANELIALIEKGEV